MPKDARGKALAEAKRAQLDYERNRQPVALGGGAVGGFVAVDQAEARLRFVGRDVESNPAAVG